MSGPKVVRVLTREEREAIARSQIAAVDEAAAALLRVTCRHSEANSPSAESLAERRASLEQMLEQGRWADLQQRASAAVSFLNAERDRIRREAVAAARAARSRRRRVSDAARTLLAALESAGQTPPAALADLVEHALSAEDDALKAMELVLGAARSSLAATVGHSSAASLEQNELARRLERGLEGRSLADWLSQQPSFESDERLDGVLGEIEAICEPSESAPFLQRAGVAAKEREPGRRALLTDSLIIDLAAHRSAARQREALLEKLRSARAALAALGDSPQALPVLSMIDERCRARDAKDAPEVLLAAQAVVEKETKARAAASRRRAVLAGLASLGYTVHDSMATALARDGKVIVRQPAESDYGVEIAVPTVGSSVQLRIVGSARPQRPRDAARDKAAETEWCKDFERMKAEIAGQGSEILIERALKPGDQALKSVVFDDRASGAAVSAATAIKR